MIGTWCEDARNDAFRQFACALILFFDDEYARADFDFTAFGDGHKWLVESRESRVVFRFLLLTCLDCDHLDIGHFFHGEFDAFASETAVAIAAVGHVVGAETGYVVDDDAAEI